MNVSGSDLRQLAMPSSGVVAVIARPAIRQGMHQHGISHALGGQSMGRGQ